MKSKKLISALVLLLAAAIIILSSLGYLGTFTPGQIILLAIMLVIIYRSASKLWFGGILFPIAILYLVFGPGFGFTRFGIPTVLGVTFCISLALDIIFETPRKKINNKSIVTIDNFDNDGKTEKLSYFYEKAKLTSKERYINTNNFNNADAECEYASLKLYFDKVQVPTGICTLNIKSKMSHIDIYIPSYWRIENQLNQTFSQIEEVSNWDGNDQTPVTLSLNGFTTCSIVRINRI